MEKVNIPKNSKIRVEWLDKPENYSKEGKNKIASHYAKKYGINRNNINVVYKAVKQNEKGDLVDVNGLGIENIMDVTYQRLLMKEVIERDGISVNFDRIIALDNKVNNELNIDLTGSQHRNWSVKWISIDNFLSFGEDNFISYDSLNGLSIVNSTPSNMGGKTTLIIDTIAFLIYGTTTKTDKNEQIFNLYTDKNELSVKGMIDIEGNEFIIERRLKRSRKKTNEWTVTNKVNYYELLPDGTEKLKNDEDAKKTTKLLKESVGTQKDFELLVLATERNLEDLIGLTTTESGKILTRIIGLEVLELKEEIVRKMYNDFAKKKKSNIHDVITVKSEIDELKDKEITYNELHLELLEKLEDIKIELVNLEDKRDKLTNSKIPIDVNISELNPSSLEEQISKIKENGVKISKEISELGLEIEKMGEINFDEDKHHELTKQLSENTSLKAVKESEIVRLKKSIENLIKSGNCSECGKKLDGVDNTKHIAKHESDILTLNNDLILVDSKIKTLNEELSVLNEVKLSIDTKNRLELKRDRLEVNIDSLRNELQAKQQDLKKYKLNLESIELNKRIDEEIHIVKTNIQITTHSKETTLTNIETIKKDLDGFKKDIVEKEGLVETIKKEEEVDRIFKIYIDLVGKKGINKLILRSVLPIINAEVQRLLDDVCDFDIEIFVDDKNDVQFLIIRDDKSKQLKTGSGFEKTASSIALRAVLSKVSTLPMPNFISFDEVLGKVAIENLENIKLLFDKIKDMYDIVFLVTHNDLAKDWGDNVITVNKLNNISSVKIN